MSYKLTFTPASDDDGIIQLRRRHLSASNIMLRMSLFICCSTFLEALEYFTR